MKKIVIRRTGNPAVLETLNVPEPVPGENEVLVGLKAVGLNWSEVMIRRGDWPIPIANGFTPGCEGAGVVEQAGAAVEDLHPGDPVIVLDFLAYLVEGQGCYAEKIIVSRDKILKFPANLDFTEAAATPMAALTAFDALINHSPLPESGTIVVTACTGAVGIAALQIAKRKNLRVIGTTRSEKKKSFVQSLGVEAVAAPGPGALKEKVAGLVGESGIDYVFDPVNGETASQLLSLMNFNGTFVEYGAQSGNQFQVPPEFLFHQVRIHGYVVLRNLENPATLQSVWNEVLPLIETRDLAIPVAKTFPLAQASQAHQAFEDHKHFGKLVLVP
ncbi:MAG: zinc-binding alcohol dehydrogenase family protein [Nitrospinaceae bacterium]